jgi:hypothetical protein
MIVDRQTIMRWTVQRETEVPKDMEQALIDFGNWLIDSSVSQDDKRRR